MDNMSTSNAIIRWLWAADHNSIIYHWNSCTDTMTTAHYTRLNEEDITRTVLGMVFCWKIEKKNQQRKLTNISAYTWTET